MSAPASLANAATEGTPTGALGQLGDLEGALTPEETAQALEVGRAVAAAKIAAGAQLLLSA